MAGVFDSTEIIWTSNKYFQIGIKSITLKSYPDSTRKLCLLCANHSFVFKLHEIKGLQSYKHYVKIVLSEMGNVGTANCFYPKSETINVQHA